MPGMSPPMRLKHDPMKSVKQVLKKYKRDDLLDEVSRWLDMEPGSPGSLKKQFILMNAIDDQGNSTMEDWEIDLKDPTTWGEQTDMPPDQFFLDLFKAIRADEKRNAKRSSYEF